MKKVLVLVMFGLFLINVCSKAQLGLAVTTTSDLISKVNKITKAASATKQAVILGKSIARTIQLIDKLSCMTYKYDLYLDFANTSGCRYSIEYMRVDAMLQLLTDRVSGLKEANLMKMFKNDDSGEDTDKPLYEKINELNEHIEKVINALNGYFGFVDEIMIERVLEIQARETIDGISVGNIKRY